MWREFSGYNPPPPNFDTYFPAKLEDRIKRLPKYGKFRRDWEAHKRPLLIMLHIFADDIGALEKWMDMAYQLAAPDALGQQMDFYVDDLWASYIFDENEFTFFRGDQGFSVDQPPLIYGVSATGEVFFYGGIAGKDSPNPESLREFCRQVLLGNVEEPHCPDFKIEELGWDTLNEKIYGTEEDVVVCFYNSQQNGTEVNTKLLENLKHLGQHLRQERVRVLKMDLRGGSAPKKYTPSSIPCLFFVQQAKKEQPVQCKYELGQWTMVRFVAENATEELNYYNRQGHRRIHAQLHANIKDYFRVS